MFDGHWYYTSSGWVRPDNKKRPRSTELKMALELISDAILGEAEHPALIYAARYLIAEYDRRELPDWVEKIASIDPVIWWNSAEIIGNIREAILTEEGENKK